MNDHVKNTKFQGIIQEIPNISVDYFLDLKSEAFFLSHCHADHMQGLDSPQLNQYLQSKEGTFIYASKQTKTILQNWQKYELLARYIKTVDLNHPTHVEVKDTNFTVTLIPSGHCIGSVMFLFEGSFGTVLYTGDFRLALGDCCKFKALKANPHHPEYGLKPIDHVYLDCTFCYECATNLPSRDECMELIFAQVKDFIAKGPEFKIFLSLAARFGSEFLFVELYRKLGIKVHVSAFKFNIYRHFPEIASAVTINSRDTPIHACCDDNKSSSKIPCINDRGAKILTIRPTTQWHLYNRYNQELLEKKDKNRQIKDEGFVRVLFSMHSSLEEIRDLVDCLKPTKITPISKPDIISFSQIEDLLNCPVQYPESLDGSSVAHLSGFKRTEHSFNDRNQTPKKKKFLFNYSQT